MVGKIERVRLREVWGHEEYDFSKWLRENIEILGDAIGVRLDDAEIEAAAGSFSVDIVAKDENGDFVIIENQLEKSNHDHLGKLITYLTMWDARTAIWIVQEPRAEHIKAVNWLNESSSASFYMFKIEAIRIGDSEPAPLLTEIVGPSEEARVVGQQKREQTETQRLIYKYWQSLLDRSKSKTDFSNNISPSTSSFIGLGGGISGFFYYYVIKQRSARVELYIQLSDLDKLDAIYNKLYASKEVIEEEFSEELEWVPLEGRKSCKIMKSLPDGGYKSDESEWPRIQDTMIDVMIRLEKALKPHIEKLSTQI